MGRIEGTLLVVALCILSGSVYAQGGSGLEAAEGIWDFGDVAKGSEKEKVFFLINNGKESVAIRNISSCCGYSVTGVSRWEIPPGEFSEITVVCDASRKNTGIDRNKVSVTYNYTDTAVLEVEINANVIQKPDSL